MLILSIVTIPVTYWEINTLNEYMALDYLEEEEITNYDVATMVSGLIGLISFTVYVWAIVAFIQWFRRAYFNLHSIKTPGLRYQEGYAVGGWFIPLANLYIPYRIMHDVWHNLKILEFGVTRNISHSFVGIWWTFFLVNSTISNIVGRMAFLAETLDEMQSVNWGYLVSAAIEIPATIVAILIVAKLEKAELLLFSQNSK